MRKRMSENSALEGWVDPRDFLVRSEWNQGFLQILFTEGRGVGLCWALLKLEGPEGPQLRKQGFSADPFYGRVRCSPMLGSFKN